MNKLRLWLLSSRFSYFDLICLGLVGELWSKGMMWEGTGLLTVWAILSVYLSPKKRA